MKPSAHLGIVCAVAAAIIWGFLGLAVRSLDDAGFSSVQMTCLRYVVVAVIVGGFVLIYDRHLLRISRKALAVLLVMGIVGTFLNSSMYFESMQRTTLSLSTVLQYISPFVVVAISVPLFHEKLTARKGLALLMAFLGCILCTGALTDPGDIDPAGIALGVGSGVCYAMYTLGSKKMSLSGYRTPTILFYTAVFCALASAPFADISGAADLLHNWHNVFLVLVLGIFLTLLPFGLYNIAVRNMEAGKAAIVTFLEPMAATLVGLAFYDETVHVGTVMGLAMILATLVLVNGSDTRIKGR